MARKLSGIQIARRITLGVFLVGFTAITVAHGLVPGLPSVDGICPFGGLETLYKFVASGEFLKRIDAGSVAILAGVVALSIVVARFFCGWFCAFGALQGVFGAIGKKLFKKRLVVPPKVDKVLRYMKYVVLVLILFLTWRAGELVIRPWDPVAAYAHLSAGPEELLGEFGIGFAILVAVLVASMFVERAFCKYVCPMGAFTAILSRVPLFRIKRDASTCTSCSLCDKACPMGIDVSKAVRVDSPECISCMECVEACPTGKGTLKAAFAGKPVKTVVAVAIGAAIFVGSLVTARVTRFATFTRETLSGRASEGTLRVEDIKGSSTWGEIAAAFGTSLDALCAELGIDRTRVTESMKINETAAALGLPSFETGAVRSAVARLAGLEYSEEEGHVPSLPAAPTPGGFALPSGYELKGSATISSVASELAVSPEAVLERLGLPADAPRELPMRELATLYGLTMGEFKSRLGR